MGDSGSTRSRETLPVMLRALLVLGFLIAIAATVIMVVVDDVRMLRLAVVLALWAALIGAFAVGRSRRDARAAAMRENDAQLAYELELSREVSARREYEADLTRQMAEQQSEQIGELREQLGRLTEVLSSLADGELTVSRLTMSAELARFRSRERVASAQPAEVTVGDIDDEETDLADADLEDADLVGGDREDADLVGGDREDVDLVDGDAVEGDAAPETVTETDTATATETMPEEHVESDVGLRAEPEAGAEPEPEPESGMHPEAVLHPGTDRHATAPGSAPADGDVPAAVWAHEHVARMRARASAAPEVTDDDEAAADSVTDRDTDSVTDADQDTEPAADSDTEPDDSSGVSVSELLAAYGLSGQSRRRRRE